jgi:glycerol transport system ATP-binding protein
VEGGLAYVNGTAIPLDHALAGLAGGAKGKLELGIRPMHLEVHANAVDGGIAVAVKSVEDQGNCKIVTMSIDGQIVRARVPEEQPAPGEKAWLRFPPQWTRLFADERMIG